MTVLFAATNGLSFTLPFIFLMALGGLLGVWVHVNERAAESEFELEFGPDWHEPDADMAGVGRPWDWATDDGGDL